MRIRRPATNPSEFESSFKMLRTRAYYFFVPAMHTAFGQKIVRPEEIHFRASDELSDEHASGRFVKLHRTSEQLDHAVAKYDDLGGQGHRLRLVISRVDHRGTELLM